MFRSNVAVQHTCVYVYAVDCRRPLSLGASAHASPRLKAAGSISSVPADELAATRERGCKACVAVFALAKRQRHISKCAEAPAGAATACAQPPWRRSRSC
jgi:hypothetical protein